MGSFVWLLSESRELQGLLLLLVGSLMLVGGLWRIKAMRWLLIGSLTSVLCGCGWLGWSLAKMTKQEQVAHFLKQIERDLHGKHPCHLMLNMTSQATASGLVDLFHSQEAPQSLPRASELCGSHLQIKKLHIRLLHIKEVDKQRMAVRLLTKGVLGHEATATSEASSVSFRGHQWDLLIKHDPKRGWQITSLHRSHLSGPPPKVRQTPQKTLSRFPLDARHNVHL